jgi:hypothetical protein
MFDPLRRLKFLPWIALLQVALLTMLVVLAIEWLVSAIALVSPPILKVLTLLFAPPLGMITSLALAVGVGALAVTILERRFRHIRINASVLWALVPCLALWVLLRSLIPLPSFLGEFDLPPLMAMIVGIFWKGRPYSRW